MNRSITVTVPHRLSQQEARRRIEAGLTRLKSEHAARVAQVNETWAGDSMDFSVSVMGQAVSGRVDVRPQDVHIRVDLPWVLAMLAERIVPELRARATKLLEEK